MIPSAVVLADYAGAIDLSSRSEVRVRATDGANPNPTFDLAESASAQLQLTDREWQHTLRYVPSVTLPDVELGAAPLIYQLASIGTAWHDRHVLVGLAEYLSYGTQNPAYLQAAPAAAPVIAGMPVTQVPSVQGIVNSGVILSGSSRTALISSFELARHWVFGSILDYTVGGGLNASSRLTLPLLRGPDATIVLRYVQPRDVFETRVSGVISEADASPCTSTLVVPAMSGITTCAPDVFSVQLSEGIRHNFAVNDQGYASVGLSEVRLRLSPESPSVDYVYPVAQVTLTHGGIVVTDTAHAILRLDAQLGPFVDTHSGTADYRVQGIASMILPYGDSSVRASISAARSIESVLVDPLTFVAGDASFDYRVQPFLFVGIGARAAWENQPPAPAYWSEVAFVQLTLRPAKITF